MTAQEAFVLALGVALAATSCAVAYAARGIAASYALLQPTSGARDLSAATLAAGATLPRQALDHVPDTVSDSLLVFLSSGCGACSAAVAAVKASGPLAPVTVFALGEHDVAASLRDHGDVVSGSDALAAVDALGLRAFPVLIHVRHGVVVGTLVGDAAGSVNSLRLWWDHGRRGQSVAKKDLTMGRSGQ